MRSFSGATTQMVAPLSGIGALVIKEIQVVPQEKH
jgi:hypothetical protein